MDTPERTSQIGTPIAKIEESPFSNFANSLSPINAIKTLHVSQTLSSLSFTSPPSVFTSPHVSIHKESRFLRRHQAGDLAKTHFSCDEGNRDSQAGQSISADEQQPNHSINEQVRGEGVSGSEAAAEPLCNVSECPTELQNVLKYDSGSLDGKAATSRGIEQNCEADASGSLVPYSQEPSADGSFGAELNSQERDIDNEETPCEWQSLISVSTDLFVFDSPNDAATLKGSFQKSLEEETNVFASLLPRFPPNDSNDVQNSHCAGPINYNEDQEATNQAALPKETNELKQTDQQPGNLTMSSLSRYLSGDSGEKSGDELFPHMQRGLRRRCLTFEMPKANNINNVIFSSSASSLPNEEMSLPNDRQPCMPTDSSRCLVSGFGLHLNKVTHLSKECRVSHQDTPSPTNQEPPMNLSASTSSEKNVSPAESGLQLVEYSSQASTNVAIEELNTNSPKKKRRKFENVGEVEGCKRCNCKKSKCLKLYCECFAAGVYCVEPCSCQECFNKPIHEDTVLATRKQIESRNPLAFAPKVIRTSDSAQDFREDSTKTPASARHKRGCNCKKSNCLKKYCECYQGGVGCSISCRCEGCKNAFGRKDGLSLIGSEVEMEETAQASEKHIMDKSSDPPALRSDEDQSSDFNLPITPLRVFRPSVPVSTSSKGKPPRSLLTIGSSMSLHPIDGPGRSTFLRSQTKIHQKHFHGASEVEIPTVLQNCSSPPSSGVKTLSPNGKRVSPPNHSKGQSPILRSSRKLILQSIPSFPSLTPRR